MDKLQDLSQSELQELLDNPERVESMALESDEVKSCHDCWKTSTDSKSQLNNLELPYDLYTVQPHKVVLGKCTVGLMFTCKELILIYH